MHKKDTVMCMAITIIFNKKKKNVEKKIRTMSQAQQDQWDKNNQGGLDCNKRSMLKIYNIQNLDYYF